MIYLKTLVSATRKPALTLTLIPFLILSGCQKAPDPQKQKAAQATPTPKPETGLLVSQPYTFTRGTFVTSSELFRFAEVPRTEQGNWTRGRYTLIVEIQPLDSTNTNVSVNARLEGRSDNVLGAEWLSLRSNGTAEEEFLVALITKITGTPPPGHEQDQQ